MKIYYLLPVLLMVSCSGLKNNPNVSAENLQAEGIDFFSKDKKNDQLLLADFDTNTGWLISDKDTLIIPLTTLMVEPKALSVQTNKVRWKVSTDSCTDEGCYRSSLVFGDVQHLGKGKFLNNSFEALGEWTLTKPYATAAYLSFGLERKVIGNDGCNQFFGYYDLTNQHLTFDKISATRKLCPGMAFNYTDIQQTDSIAFDGLTLQLYDKGTLKFVFSK